MIREMDDLENEVARNTTVDQSALILIQGIVARLEEAKGDPARLTALTASLKASSDSLASAISRNTPAPAPEPAPSPTPSVTPSFGEPSVDRGRF